MRDEGVGPVLHAGPAAAAVLAAIRDENAGVVVVDRGAYLRVMVPGRCSVTRAAVERHAGQPFLLPGDLEKVMPSFKGRLTISSDAVTWEAARRVR